ncbi:MAG: hypothetical protein KA746_15220 [Pyrinomonadaceae bacterium]|nr:hypothetical protein [Pyrinomonadaceae bacterium]
MPYASQRYSADTIISNRAALGDAAFGGFSRMPNGQASTKHCTIASLTPSFLTPFLSKSQVFVLLIIAVIQLIASGCSNGDRAYIPPITGAVFTSPDEAWVLKHKGVLKRLSIDGRSINISDAQQRVQGMSFISPTQAWTVDADWNIRHFDGVNWEFVGHNNDNKFPLVWPSSVSFADENVGWARTYNELFVTDDGGRTWKRVLVTELGGEPLRLFVVDRDNGYLHGVRGSVKRTTDRGKTWKSIELGPAGDVTAFACRDGGRECWAGTARGEIFAISGDASPKRIPFPTPKEMTITDIYLSGADSLLVSGFTLVRDGNPSPYGVLLTTSNDGAAWKKIDVPQDDGFEQVASFGNTIWLASHTAIYRSSDTGQSWTKVFSAENDK